jgi:hypothetical protein
MPRRSPESHEPLAQPVFVSEPDRTKPPSPEVPEDLRAEHDRLMSEYLPLKAKHDAYKTGAGERPTLEEYKRITALAQGILDTRKGRAPLETEPTSELHERAKELAKELSRELTARAKEFGQTSEYTIRPPELPPDLTEAHLAAVREALGSGAGFAERVLPALADLNDLDETYTDAMYPKEQSRVDKDRGLVSYRPSWWKDASDKDITKTDETWGEAYTRSMRQELNTIGGSLVLLDTAIKPKYQSGEQQYGSVEGDQSDADPLLPLFREAFGPEANRFKHSWDDLETKLIPLAKEKIKAELASRGLKEVSFTVMLVPATLDNLEMTLNTPQSSTTDTWEWTSTQLKDGENNDTGHRLDAGDSVYGGAGRLLYAHRSLSLGNLGARLAVVFKKLDTGTAA